MHRRSNPLTAPVPKGSALAQFTATMLILEMMVCGFIALVAYGLKLASPGIVATMVGGTAALCLVSAVLMRRAKMTALAIGSFAQGLLLLVGVWMPGSLVVSIVFLGLWIASLYWGVKIDREREERRAEQAAWEAAHGIDGGGETRAQADPAAPEVADRRPPGTDPSDPDPAPEPPARAGN
ncbi:MAG: DUF4233 domain-containing protein [Flaviflexus sp.]|nr:DUF4233 domain-containing protein [Flaviflexus sp.]